MALIECVPNVSEGRRPDVVNAIAEAVSRVNAVRLLDRSADEAHNRSVLTVAGQAPAVQQAVMALFAAALDLIDLRHHTGAHPRLGAVDVVPFIPLAGATMAQCVALATETAALVATRFQLPVYLYEEAAATPGRRNLADIRRGEFEGLAAKMASSEWTPDYGPSRPHPTAGATVIGARAPLIAFNVNLATDRLDVAKAVAAAVRQSSGGLPFVKALGIPLPHRGIVQVSMNLTNFEHTSITRAFEAVRSEAERHGTTVVESEVVGLVPEAALPPEPERSLLLSGFTNSQVLERRLLETGGKG
jgi:glutamate formiminotransferase / 5-formyltetrahydrofolate cyclo-ligase